MPSYTLKKEIELKTDFDALAAMKDEDIDCSDIPALTEEELNSDRWFPEVPESWYRTARVRDLELAVAEG